MLMLVAIVSGWLTRIKVSGFRFIRRLPVIGSKIREQVREQTNEMEASFHRSTKGQKYVQKLPAKGLSEVKKMNCILTIAYSNFNWI